MYRNIVEIKGVFNLFWEAGEERKMNFSLRLIKVLELAGALTE